MDQAFIPFREMLDQMLAGMREELVDAEEGVRSHIYECTIEMPVECDLSREAGRLRLGTTPPLYDVETTFRPSFHRLTLTATIE